MAQDKSTNIGIDSLVQEAGRLREQGYRLSQIGCSSGRVYEINYSFEKGYEFLNLKVCLPSADTELPSISLVYRCAFLYENEISELFGLKIAGMAVDYNGNFYRISLKAPFKGKKEQEKV